MTEPDAPGTPLATPRKVRAGGRAAPLAYEPLGSALTVGIAVSPGLP